MKRLFLILCALLSSVAASASVTCYAVAPTGAGSANGSSWSNAKGGFPTLVRGVRYYVADGSYSTSPGLNIAASGTTIIEIRKAQSYDFGRASDGCTNDISAGFNASTMGSAQAIWTTFWDVSMPYLTINGNGTSTAPGCGSAFGSSLAVNATTASADCGILLDNITGGMNSSNPAQPALYMVSGVNNLLVEYMEIRENASNSVQYTLFSGQGSVGNPNTYQHMYLHNSGCTFMQDMGNYTVSDHNYFWGTEINGGSACHGQAEFEVGGTSHGTRSNSVYRDISGTAVWTFAASVGTNDSWTFYNNIVYYSSPAQAFGGTSDATLDCINGNLCTNFLFYHNQIVNCNKGTTFGFGPSCGIGFADGASGGSITIKDNLFYSNVGPIVLTTNGTTLVEDYNSILNGGSFGSGAHDVHVASGSPNPFVNWQNGNFSLASDNANWNNFISLGAPYDTDITGAAFTTDRGAYQFQSGAASFNVTPATVPAHHSGAITLSISGSGLTSSATFTISGVTGAVLSSCTNTATSGSCHLVTGSGTGTATITDTTDSVSTTITIATATLATSPSAGNVSTTPTLTLTNTNGLWLSETAAGLFTVAGSGCVGDSIGTPTVTTNNAATAVLTTGSGSCTITVTDTSTTATAAFTVAAPTAPTVTTGTAGSLTSSTATISGNSYVCAGACSVVTSEGTCYALTANPTAPCTSDGTISPFNSSLTSLLASTTYHFRAFATNVVGTSYGSDQTFSTPAPGITYLLTSCTQVVTQTGSSATWTASCTPAATGDALVMFAQCHPSSGTITGITLTSPGWTINQLVPPASTGSNSWGALFGAIAPNTSAATFTATFTGGANCSNFSIWHSAEFSGNDPTGGATTFNATGSASGSGSTCNQPGAALTPPLNNEAVWYACLLGSATTATSPWTLGTTDNNGNSTEYQTLTGGASVAQTPAFNGSAGAYVIEGVAIAPLTTVVACVPPAYCAYTGTDIVIPSSTPPNLGTYIKTGATVLDTSYLSHTLPSPYQSSRIARCTDQNFTPTNGLAGFSAGQGGFASIPMFNTTSSLIHVVAGGSGSAMSQFNPTTMVCAPAITKDKDLTNPGSSSTRADFGQGQFSWTNPNLWWVAGGLGTEVVGESLVTPIAINPVTGFYSLGATAADMSFGMPIGANVAEWQSNHAYTAGVYVKHTLTGGDLSTWAATTAFNQGDIIYPGGVNCGWMVSVAGTTSGTQPTWPTPGGVCGPNPTGVVDGTVHWRSLISSPPAFIFQLVSSGGTSGGSTPAFVPVSTGHPDIATMVTDGSLTWENVGVNLASLNGVWNNAARVSQDDLKFSDSMSIDTYGAISSSAVTVGTGISYANASGDQGTGSNTVVYDSTTNIYHMMNALTSIQTDWVCTGGTGYNCSGGAFVQTPKGTATGSPCPFLLHESSVNVPLTKITLSPSGSFINNGGGCPAASPVIWYSLQSFNAATQLKKQIAPGNHPVSGANTTVGVAQNGLTWGFSTGMYGDNFDLSNPGNVPSVSWQAYPCLVSWTRGSSTQPCQLQVDSHISWAFNPNLADNTPSCGTFFEVEAATANSANPGAPYEGEVVCFSTTPTENSVGTAQFGTQWRFAHTWSFQTNQNFNLWYNIAQESTDGRYLAFGTEWYGQFGSTTGAAPVLPIANPSVLCLGGFPRLASTAYTAGTVVVPIASLNGGGLPFDAYQALTSGTTGSSTPAWASTNPGDTIVDGGVTWQDLNVGNCRGDVVIVELAQGALPHPASVNSVILSKIFPRRSYDF